MDDAALRRYSRQLLLPEVDVAGQQRLLDARALIIGLGGLGSPATLYLASSGVGTLAINDFDRVTLDNLQRQIIHTHPDIDQPKTRSARAAVERLNPTIRVDEFPERLTPEALRAQADAADVVIDASDNFATRFAVNAACVATGTPLVSGAVVRLEGQVSVFDPRRPDSPCYRCLYAPDAAVDVPTCDEQGILAPVAGVVGSLQAVEALKILLDVGETLVGRLLRLDALTMAWRLSTLRRDPACPVCGG